MKISILLCVLLLSTTVAAEEDTTTEYWCRVTATDSTTEYLGFGSDQIDACSKAIQECDVRHKHCKVMGCGAILDLDTVSCNF